jgi:hypothetical protein
VGEMTEKTPWKCVSCRQLRKASVTDLLSCLPDSLGAGHRQKLCAQLGKNPTSRTQLGLLQQPLGSSAAVESSPPVLSLSNAEATETLQQCEDTEGARQGSRQRTRRCNGQRQRGPCSSTSSTSSLAWLCSSWTPSGLHC